VKGGELIGTAGLVVGRGRPLLRGVDLRIEPGQTWFMLGRNGAGKSTLIYTLLGLLPALGGEIRQAPAVRDRTAVGYVPQEQRFQQSLPVTVTEFVRLGLGDRGPAAARHARTAAALQAMGVEDLAPRNAGELSLGQRRRVLVARALARRPALLVLDEPTASLDAVSADQLGKDLDGLRRDDGLSLLVVSHDLGLARRYATHVALVAAGAVRTGAAADVFADPATAAALGSWT